MLCGWYTFSTLSTLWLRLCGMYTRRRGAQRGNTEDDTRLVTCGRRVSTRRNDVSAICIYTVLRLKEEYNIYKNGEFIRSFTLLCSADGT